MASRTDPTKLAGLRRKFASAVRKKVVELKYAVASHVARDDAFGLGPSGGGGLDGTPSSTPLQHVWAHLLPAEKLEEFWAWWEKVAEEELWSLEWYSGFVTDAYTRGLSTAYGQVNLPTKLNPNLYAWELSAFLGKVKTLPSPVPSILSQIKNNLKAATVAAGQKMGRLVGDALTEEWTPKKLARELVGVIESVLHTRAKAIANTELTRAHAQGVLDALLALGETEVGGRAEQHSCEKCESIEGAIMSIEDAQGLIPVHPNCICAWEAVVITRKRLPRRRRRAVKKPKVNSRQGVREPPGVGSGIGNVLVEFEKLRRG